MHYLKFHVTFFCIGRQRTSPKTKQLSNPVQRHIKRRNTTGMTTSVLIKYVHLLLMHVMGTLVTPSNSSVLCAQENHHRKRFQIIPVDLALPPWQVPITSIIYYLLFDILLMFPFLYSLESWKVNNLCADDSRGNPVNPEPGP